MLYVPTRVFARVLSSHSFSVFPSQFDTPPPPHDLRVLRIRHFISVNLGAKPEVYPSLLSSHLFQKGSRQRYT